MGEPNPHCALNHIHCYGFGMELSPLWPRPDYFNTCWALFFLSSWQVIGSNPTRRLGHYFFLQLLRMHFYSVRVLTDSGNCHALSLSSIWLTLQCITFAYRYCKIPNTTRLIILALVPVAVALLKILAIRLVIYMQHADDIIISQQLGITHEMRLTYCTHVLKIFFCSTSEPAVSI